MARGDMWNVLGQRAQHQGPKVKTPKGGRSPYAPPLVCKHCNSAAVEWEQRAGAWVLCDPKWLHPRSRQLVKHACGVFPPPSAEGFGDVDES